MFFSGQSAWRIWLILGLGLSLYGYQLWSQVAKPMEEEALEQQVELRYREEIAQLQQRSDGKPFDIGPEWKEKYRQAIRAELERPRREKKQQAETILGFGLLMTVVAASLFVLGRLAPPPGPPNAINRRTTNRDS